MRRLSLGCLSLIALASLSAPADANTPKIPIYVFAGESDILRNPADPHTALVFDKSIRGHTDQFLFKFRKP